MENNPFAQLGNTFVSWIPPIAQAVIVIIVGYIIAKILKTATTVLLHRFGLNREIMDLKAGRWIKRITDDPAALIGSIVYWVVFILVIAIAVPLLNVPAFNQLIQAFYSYIPKIVAALLILVVAVLVSEGIYTLTKRFLGDTPTGRIVMSVGPGVVMAIAVFMILVQLGIATPIVLATYIALIGSLALGFALAFGLGGRDLASRILDEAYRQGQKKVEEAKRDYSSKK